MKTCFHESMEITLFPIYPLYSLRAGLPAEFSGWRNIRYQELDKTD